MLIFGEYNLVMEIRLMLCRVVGSEFNESGDALGALKVDKQRQSVI